MATRNEAQVKEELDSIESTVEQFGFDSGTSERLARALADIRLLPEGEPRTALQSRARSLYTL